MSKKHRQSEQPAASPPQPPRRSFSPLVAVAAAIAIVAVAVGLYARIGRTDAASQTTAATTPPAAPLAPLPGPPPFAKFGPHQQANLPPLPFTGYPPARPVEVVSAAYRFAAQHPEVLGYVPCYCGCERSGHRGNDDCFVSSRARNGDVVDWEPHGMT